MIFLTSRKLVLVKINPLKVNKRKIRSLRRFYENRKIAFEATSDLKFGKNLLKPLKEQTLSDMQSLKFWIFQKTWNDILF